MSNEQTAEVATDAVPTPTPRKAITRDPILVALIRTCELLDGLDEGGRAFALNYIFTKYGEKA